LYCFAYIENQEQVYTTVR